MALALVNVGHGVRAGGRCGARRWGVQPWAVRSAPGAAADVERARARFRAQVAVWLAEQGVEWPRVTEDQWGATHYSLPPATPRAGWLRRWLYGPTGRR